VQLVGSYYTNVCIRRCAWIRTKTKTIKFQRCGSAGGRVL